MECRTWCAPRRLREKPTRFAQGYISIVFAAIIGYLGWQEAITPLTVAGVILVVAGARWTMRGREPVPAAPGRE